MTAASAEPMASFCGHCGNTLRPGTKFCPKCGVALSDSSFQQSVPPRPDTVNTLVGSNAIAALERMAADHPGDEGYQKLLAIQLHDDAMSDWWKDPDDGQYLCTSWCQISHARRQLDSAAALKFNDPRLRAELAKTRELVESMEQRQYTGNWVQVVILGMFGFFPGVIWCM